MTFTVSEVARRTGVSVRALHHYDEIGLLRPSGRSRSGYRLYGPADLERLQQILFFRELGFPLEEILRITTDPAFDVAAALRTQRELLAERVVKVRALLDAVDAAIVRLETGGRPMSNDELTAAFEGFDHGKYEEEAERRWGDTDAYEESKRRTARYTKRDWETIKAEAGAIYERLAALMEAGTPAAAVEAMDAAEAHRRHIDRWFYPCPREQHRGLGQLYVDDARFTAFFDGIRPGLARYACEAFAANAAR